ncbi:nucleotidyltransferase family protein [Sphingomonas montana]|uniref:nucleotidyltransferase domain-containing protein n=1 Tax=Sphingomonas montana TaxID=1843236 RepID=UPI00096DC5AA|nr:nucleotidyltransferase family protein [Sphingomonas montana]
MNAARDLVAVLADPAQAAAFDDPRWTGMLCAAVAERLAGTLAERLAGVAVPDTVAAWRDNAAVQAAQERRSALWEAEMARRALAPLGVPVVLLKGTAYVAGGLAAGRGRSIGDLDILVPRAKLDAVEAALLAAGWEWVKPDPYDDAYYRQWMHELPPLIHASRDRMIDVHHTILPPTARPTPDADLLIADSVPLPDGLRMLCADDRIVHAAAHLLADGDMAGGLRNLWDIHCLIGEAGTDKLAARAARHGLGPAVARAGRLAHALYGTDVPVTWRRLTVADRLFRRRMLAVDGWGRDVRRGTRFAFYVRSHWLRMPPLMLARHLWVKWRRGKQ